MKQLTVIVSVLFIVLLAGCQGKTIQSESSKSCGDDTQDSLITEFPLSEVIKSASKTYKVTSSADTSRISFITLSSSIQWPQRVGDHKISVLQDSIVAIVFGDKSGGGNINAAIRAFVTSLDRYGLGDIVQEVESVPVKYVDTPSGQLFAEANLQLVECSEHTMTFSAENSQYLGGAHISGSSRPFTFNLADQKIISYDWLFSDQSAEVIRPLLMKAVAQSIGDTENELKQALLCAELPVSKIVYLIDGNIMFHYNPYEILPYSYGAVDAFISPYQVRDVLTTQASALLLP